MNANTKRIRTILAALVGVGLCFGAYRFGVKQGRQMNTADSSNRIEVPSSGPAADVKRDDPVSQGDRVMPDGLTGEVAADPPARMEIESEQRQRLMRNLDNNLALPGMSRIIQQQQRVLMAEQYRDLIEAYGLNDKEKEYFLDLLTARQMYHVDLGMKLMTGMLSEDERNELLQRVGAGIEEMNGEIDWFLNSEKDSEYFNYYERTEGERTFVGEVSATLNQSGSPLEKSAGDELVAIMHEEISAYPFSVQFEENGEPVFSRFTEENINTFTLEMQGLRDPVIQKAAQVLDRQQLEAFANAFGQYIAFYDQRLRMVQQLFNPAQ